MLRVIAVVALVGCGSGSPTGIYPDGPAAGCPTTQDGIGGDTIDNSPCTLAAGQECFVVDNFSSCESAWYTCGADGRFHYDRGLAAQDGASCADAPITSCEAEGNDCSAEPTGQDCQCVAGTWQCTCRCYDGEDCPICPAEYRDGYENTGCGPVGNVCTWPGHSCTCVDNGAGLGMFSCQ